MSEVAKAWWRRGTAAVVGLVLLGYPVMFMWMSGSRPVEWIGAMAMPYLATLGVFLAAFVAMLVGLYEEFRLPFLLKAQDTAKEGVRDGGI